MQVVRHLTENRIQIAGPPIFLCHECSPDFVKEANAAVTARVEVAWPVTGPAVGSGEIRRYVLPGGRMVRTVHRGPYETCEGTYQAAFAWMKKKSLAISGPIREVYPNDPREIPPEEILTEIYIPV